MNFKTTRLLRPYLSRRERVWLIESDIGTFFGCALMVEITICFVLQYLVSRDYWLWGPLKIITNCTAVAFCSVLGVMWLFNPIYKKTRDS